MPDRSFIKFLSLTAILGFLLLAACTTPQPTATIAATAILTQTSTPTISATQTPQPTSTETSSLHFYSPKIEKVCPAKRNVPIKQLGVKPGSQLFLTDPNETGIWQLSFEDGTPKLLSKISIAKWFNKPISPDGHWIAHPTRNEDHSSSIWIESLVDDEKKELWNIKYTDGLVPRVMWLSNNKLLVVNHCRSLGCHVPLKILNIDTGEQSEDLETQGGFYDYYLTFFENSNQNYALFSSYAYNSDRDYANFTLYDYANKQSRPAFPWLNQKVFMYPYYGTNLDLEFSKENTAILLKQSYGFDLGVFENSLDALSKSDSYDVAMKRISAVWDFHQLEYVPIGLDSSTHSLFLYINYDDYSENEQSTSMVTKVVHIEGGFFALDYQNIVHPDDYFVFKDYCFTMKDHYFAGVFGDGLIAASGSEQHEILLLNLKTGFISRLSGWNLLLEQ